MKYFEILTKEINNIMTLEIQSKVCENIFIAKLAGEPLQTDVNIWIGIFEDAQAAGAAGLLIINNMEESISPDTIIKIRSKANNFPGIRAIANCRANLPQPKNMVVYALMQRVAQSSNKQFRNFFDQDEALDWLQQALMEE